MKKANHDSKNNSNPLIIPIFIMNSGCPHRYLLQSENYCRKFSTENNKKVF